MSEMDRVSRLLNPDSTEISKSTRIQDIRRAWDDKTRQSRAVAIETIPWSIPVIRTADVFAAVERPIDEETWITTQTINRWRKSTAKTVHAAEMCLQLEAEQSDVDHA